jgi:hypothetical protein
VPRSRTRVFRQEVLAVDDGLLAQDLGVDLVVAAMTAAPSP